MHRGPWGAKSRTRLSARATATTAHSPVRAASSRPPWLCPAGERLLSPRGRACEALCCPGAAGGPRTSARSFCKPCGSSRCVEPARLPNKAAGSRPLSNPQGLAEGPRSAEVFTCLKMYQAINRSCSQSPAILGWFFPYFLPPFVSFNKEEREERGKQSPLSALFSEPQRARSRSFSQTLRQGAWAAGEEADCRGDTRLLEDPGAERVQRGSVDGGAPEQVLPPAPSTPRRLRVCSILDVPQSWWRRPSSCRLGSGSCKLWGFLFPAQVSLRGAHRLFSEWTQNSFPKGSDALGPRHGTRPILYLQKLKQKGLSN